MSNHHKLVCQAWNVRHEIGTPVRYWSGVKEGPGKTGVTTSEAFLLGGHTPSVLIDTCRGCVALTHVEAIGDGAEEQAAAVRCPRCQEMRCKRRDVISFPTGGHYCRLCQMEFDADPEEGGDWDDRDPARRLDRQEQRRARR